MNMIDSRMEDAVLLDLVSVPDGFALKTSSGKNSDISSTTS